MSSRNNELRDSEKATFEYPQTLNLPYIIGVYSYKDDSDVSSLLSIL